MFNPEYPTLKSRLASGNCVAVFWMALGSVAMVEAAVRAGCDTIVIDLQHGLWERRELESAIGIVPHTIPVIIRVAENTAQAIGMALDAGAEGVMVPMIETAAQARQALRFAKYPPHGVRSGGGVRPLYDFGAYIEGASEIAVLLMVETATGLANVAAIAGTKDLDMVFIGTGDLAMSLKAGPSHASQHAAACKAIKRACHAAGVPCGAFSSTPEAALNYRNEGYGMVVTASDSDVVSRGFARASEAYRQGIAAAPPSDSEPPVGRGTKRSPARKDRALS
jgi:2-keto-3-deoxy-L-rhamnonate aldolase RhmA